MFNLNDYVQLREEIKDDINGHIKKGSIGYIKDISKSGGYANVIVGNKTVMVKVSRLNIIKKARQKRRYQKRKK